MKAAQFTLLATLFICLGTSRTDRDRAEAVGITSQTLATLGVLRAPLINALHQASPLGKSGSWLCNFRSNLGDTYCAYLRDDQREVDMITSSRLGLRRQRGGEMSLAGPGIRSQVLSKETASSRLRALASRIAGIRTILLDQFNYRATQLTGGRTRPGDASAHYSYSVGGHRFIDRACSLYIELDPADGALLSYNSTLWTAVVVDTTLPHVSLASANASAAQAVKFPVSSFDKATSEMGFASKQGASRAHLCWLLRLPQLRIIVDGQTGEVLSLTI